MKASFICAMLACMGSSMAFADVHWGYAPKDGPNQWASLDQKYQACAGYNQSPINISQTVSAQLPALEFNYNSHATSMIHNGHTVQIDFADGAFLNLDGQRFALKQFHLHTPSENVIRGQSYPMELHLVHASDQGELAVVAMMFEQGAENSKLQQLWQLMPRVAGEKVNLNNNLQASQLLPTQQSYYRFNGSLTTPPCTEGVRWIIFKDVHQASAAQIQAFAERMGGHSNNRPIQATNARLVLEQVEP